MTVAEVQVDLGAHGVTVESATDTKVYQSDPELKILGKGFNSSTTLNTLKWGNSLRGKGVNYTIVSSSPSQLTLALRPGSKWRSNPGNLPGALKLLAVNAGAGLVPVGPTEAKKGRTVATVFEDPYVERRRNHERLLDPSAELSASHPRRSQEPGPVTLALSRVRPPRTIQLGSRGVAAAPRQLVSSEYPRRIRGVAATRLH